MSGEQTGSSGEFPAERLRVYHMAVDLQERLQGWYPKLNRMKPDLARHLERAVDSIVLNLAEGATEFSTPEKRRFYRIALRSGGEAGAALGFFVRRLPALEPEMKLLGEIMGMMTGLCRMQRRGPKDRITQPEPEPEPDPVSGPDPEP